MKESFKDIPGYDGIYQISNFGRVRNTRLDSFLKTRVLDNGYERVNLFRKGKRKTKYIHRLVAENFISKKSACVKHRDGNKLNNKLSNLYYDEDMFFHQPKSAGSLPIKVKNEETKKIYPSIKEAALENEVGYEALILMLKGKIKNTTSLEYA